jgi:bla regulator protein BlaR1
MSIRILCGPDLASKVLLSLAGWIVFAAPVAGFAQAAVAQAAKIDAKPMTFDVASIRQYKGDEFPSHGATANGYHMTNLLLMVPILDAYVPQTGGIAKFMYNQIQGLPDWSMKERYEIDAKVSEADLAEWKKPGSQSVMLPIMLQAMLEDRLKLVVHRDVKEVPVYALVVGKNGPRFKEANSAETHQGMTYPNGNGTLVPEDGGRTIHLYGASMTAMAAALSNWAGRPVQDKTGLTGRYDLQMLNPDIPPASVDGGATPDPGASVFTSVEGLGLKLVPAKGQVEMLVIDHMERPSQN